MYAAGVSVARDESASYVSWANSTHGVSMVRSTVYVCVHRGEGQCVCACVRLTLCLCVQQLLNGGIPDW